MVMYSSPPLGDHPHERPPRMIKYSIYPSYERHIKFYRVLYGGLSKGGLLYFNSRTVCYTAMASMTRNQLEGITQVDQKST